mgnify:FL=1|jgi:hypothetical protein
MKFLQYSSVAVLLAAVMPVHATDINVTIKNAGAVQIKNSPSGSNDSSTQLKSTPTPLSIISQNARDMFTVRSPYSNSASATFTYTAGNKKCAFSTSVTVMPRPWWAPPGSDTPGQATWSKTATSTGLSPATCQATITGMNFQDYSYSVEFTMK